MMKKIIFILPVAAVCVLLPIQSSRSAPGSDQKETWKALGPYGGCVMGIAKNPKNPNELYAVASSGVPGQGQVFRSADGGSSWNRTGVNQYMCMAIDIAVNPVNPDIIYVLGHSSFYKSTDKGATFAEYYLEKAHFRRIAVNPKKPSQIYASGSYDTDSGSCMAVFKSVDGGAHWTIKKLEPGNSDWGDVYGLSVSPLNPNVIYACGSYRYLGSGERHKVLKSTNAGDAWTNVTGPIKATPFAVLVHPKDVSKVYVATSDGIFRSSDGGASWSSQSSPSSLQGGPLAVDSANSDILYSGSKDLKAFYKSTDGGMNWTESTRGIYGSCNGVCISGKKIFLGQTAGLFKSLNGGVSWKTSHKGMKATNVPAFALAPSSPNIIYAEVASYAFLKSSNGGGTWQKMPDFYRCESILKFGVHPAHADVIYILAGG
jgi:photosystem II stability/assembly factor-like uncharacterized protein